MDATINHKSLSQPWSGTVAISDYTRLAAMAHGYGQAKVFIPADHSLIADTNISEIRGVQITIHQALLGSAPYIQIGKPDGDDRGWYLTCYESGYLLKLLKVPVRPRPYQNVPAGVLARLALTAGLAMTSVPIQLGDFAEAAPYVEEYEFTGQSVDQVLQDLMTLTGQEWEITSAGLFNWIARQGRLYEIALTEGYDFCITKRFEPEDDPVGRVVVTDQRGYTTDPVVAYEHAADLTARTLATRADTASKGATDQLAQSLLNQGRTVRAAGTIGLYPQGGSIAVTIPGPTTDGSGVGFPLMGGGFVLMGGGFTLYGGGGGGGSSTTIDMDWPTFAAPNWQIRPGDVVRIIGMNTGIRGRHSGLYRVRGITYGDQYLYPTVDLIQEPYWTMETLPVAKRSASLGASPPMTLERLMLLPFQRQGTPVDAARIASTLEPNQVPLISQTNGTLTAAQMPSGGSGVADPAGTFADLAAVEAWAASLYAELGTRGAIN